MSVSLLQREAFSPAADDEADLLLGDLGQEAEETLGYLQLSTAQATASCRKALQRTLAEMDVRPFTRSSVEAYKEACEQKANGRAAEAASIGFALSFLVFLAALPLLVVTTLMGLSNAAFSAAVTAISTGCAAGACGWLMSRWSCEKSWKMHPLSDYSQPVPEFALQTAVDIKQAHPEVEFLVCALEQNRIVVDPFLVLRTGKGDQQQDFYLEVWNESKFRAQREA